MSYTTAANILKYFNGLTYSDSEGVDNNISEGNVTQFIEEQSVLIDLQISKQYILPLTDASDLTFLKLICDKAVVCQIDKILRTFAYNDEADMSRARNYCKEAKEMLGNILNGSIPLNANQKSRTGFKYNRTKVYKDDCRQELTSSSDE